MKTLVLLLICATGAVAQAQGQETASRAQARRPATLAQQKICADEVHKVDREQEGDKPDPNAIHYVTAHYNVAQNICYMTSVTTYTEKGQVTSMITITDAFEGTLRGTFMKNLSQAGKAYCELTPPNADKIECSDEDEYRKGAGRLYGVQW